MPRAYPSDLGAFKSIGYLGRRQRDIALPTVDEDGIGVLDRYEPSHILLKFINRLREIRAACFLLRELRDLCRLLYVPVVRAVDRMSVKCGSAVSVFFVSTRRLLSVTVATNVPPRFIHDRHQIAMRKSLREYPMFDRAIWQDKYVSMFHVVMIHP